MSIKKGLRCPICNNTDHFTDKVIEETIKHQGETITVPDVHISECDVCGEFFYTRESDRKLEKATVDLRRRHAGMMTSDEIVALRKKYDLTQEEFSQLIGMADKTFARYENGYTIQSASVDKLFKILAESSDAMDILTGRSGDKNKSTSNVIQMSQSMDRKQGALKEMIRQGSSDPYGGHVRVIEEYSGAIANDDRQAALG